MAFHFGKNKQSVAGHVTEDEGKEAILRLFGDESACNQYYRSVAGIYRIAEFALLALLLIFIVFSAFYNSSEITYDNLSYIVRNYAYRMQENGESAADIFYSPDSSHSYALYGDGLAVSGLSGVSVFSATGRKTCSMTNGYTSPRLACSDKYVMVYDSGGYGYTLYNTYFKVFDEELEYKITGVSLGADGRYAIITGAEGYNSALRFYDANFKLTNRYLKTGYIVSAAVGDGGALLMATLSAGSDGEYSTELMLCMAGEDAARATVSTKGTLPLRCGFIGDGFYLLCEDSAYLYSSDATLLAKYGYGGRELRDAEFSNSTMALLFRGDSVKRSLDVVVLSQRGEEIRKGAMTGTAISLAVRGDNAYLLTDTGIYTVGDGEVGMTEVTGVSYGDKLLAYGDEKLYLCTDSGARLIRTDAGR